MSELTIENYQNVFQTIRQWPPNKRFSLVQDIISTLKFDTESPRPQKSTLARALGLLATDQPAPSDEDIAHWLEEHRLEKYTDARSI